MSFTSSYLPQSQSCLIYSCIVIKFWIVFIKTLVFLYSNKGLMFLEYRSLNPSRVVSWCLVFWVGRCVKAAIHTFWFNLDNMMLLQLVSSLSENLSSFLDFLVTRNILTFSTSKRKMRKLLKNNVPRYYPSHVSLLWSISMFFYYMAVKHSGF